MPVHRRVDALEFRRLSPDLEGPLVDLFAEMASDETSSYFHPHPLTESQARERCRYEGRDLYYAAIENGRVLAYGMLRGWDEGYERPSLGVAVHPGARGSGLGRAFMHFLAAAAKQRGARELRLTLDSQNKPMVRLCERLGYQLTRRWDTRCEYILDLAETA